MNSNKEFGVYVFSSPNLIDSQTNKPLLKIGQGNIKNRLKDANSETYSAPTWRIEFAKYSEKPYEHEQLIHQLIESFDATLRTFGKKRELFTVPLHVVKNIFKFLPGDFLTEENFRNDTDDTDDNERPVKIWSPNLADGTEIRSVYNDTYLYGIYNKEKGGIKYDDKIYTRSGFHTVHCALQGAQIDGTRSGPRYCSAKIGGEWVTLDKIGDNI